jgi:isopenicillin N synthase-like dioxygenase
MRSCPPSAKSCTAIVSGTPVVCTDKADNELHRFALQLVQIFALALGLEETALDRFFTEPLSDITVQHCEAGTRDSLSRADRYTVDPAQTPCIPGTVLAPHADHSAFTILLQSESHLV